MALTKRNIVLCIILILIVTLSYTLFSVANSKNILKTDATNENELFSVFLESTEGSNVYTYTEVTEWPTDYVFNATKSYCTYGSELSWDGVGVFVSLTGSDECFVYFKYPPDIYLSSLTLDGVPVSSIPAKSDNLRVDTTCTNADVKWDYNEWSYSIENVTNKVSCSISFVTINNTPNLSDYIIDLHNGVNGTDSIYFTNNSEYRYTGLNPNNFIWFNNELWRIIGVFDDNSHGQTGENLVKIVNEKSFTYVLDTGNDNSWADSGGGATLKTLYNTYYYNSTNGTSYTGCSADRTTAKRSCDFTYYGLGPKERELTAETTWYLGAINTSGSVTALGAYNMERSSTVTSGTYSTTNAYIGLAYLSDMGYASEYSCWTSSVDLFGYQHNNYCANNWFLEKNDKTITFSGEYGTTTEIVGYDSSMDYYSANNGWYNTYPTLHLTADAKYIDGNGTLIDPYIIN